MLIIDPNTNGCLAIMGFPGRVWGAWGWGLHVGVSREGLGRASGTQMPALVIQPSRWGPPGPSGGVGQ